LDAILAGRMSGRSSTSRPPARRHAQLRRWRLATGNACLLASDACELTTSSITVTAEPM
jgi:hypothetical protein